jgi:hypothetical protein
MPLRLRFPLLPPKIPEAPERWTRWAQFGASIVTIAAFLAIPVCAIRTWLIPSHEEPVTQSLQPTSIPGDAVAFANVWAFGQPFADLASVGLEPDPDGSYDREEYTARTRYRALSPVAIAAGDSFQFRLSFTLSNGRDGYRTVVRSVRLVADSYVPVSGDTVLGCPAGGQGGDGLETIIPFDAVVDSTEVGAEHDLALDVPEDTLPALSPDEVRVFSGSVEIDQPGRYKLHLVVDFDNSAGASGTLTSDSIGLTLVPAKYTLYSRAAGSDPTMAPCPTNRP